jgi:formylglycine-generating enzyme required for sulfatase activity
MASESVNFSGASWQTYSTAPLFTFSIGNGIKTVYFKVKNGAGESAAVSDSIRRNENANITEETILLPGNVPLVMVWCPAGTFLMGQYPGEQDSNPLNESPQHQVTLQGFWMGKYELTKAQWTAVMETTPWLGLEGVLNDQDSPAVYISWNDTQAFITKLNAYITDTGQGAATFRLPSEAQWEYAVRAGTTTRFYWGDDPSYSQVGDYAWYWGNCSSQQYAHVIGQKLPNAWGLYDMSGNVWEWCQDWWSYGYTAGAVTDPSGPATGSRRVDRGGSWGYFDYVCRSASRLSYFPTVANINIGFRLAR